MQTAETQITALGVSPKKAAAMLDCGLTKLYELINDNELESYLDGSARKITVRSIEARVKRLLVEQKKAA